MSWVTQGAFLYARDSRNFGWKSSGKVPFGSFQPEYSDRNLPVHFDKRFIALLFFNYVGKRNKKWYDPFLLVGPVWSENVVPFSSGIATGFWPVTLALESTQICVYNRGYFFLSIIRKFSRQISHMKLQVSAEISCQNWGVNLPPMHHMTLDKLIAQCFRQQNQTVLFLTE